MWTTHYKPIPNMRVGSHQKITLPTYIQSGSANLVLNDRFLLQRVLCIHEHKFFFPKRHKAFNALLSNKTRTKSKCQSMFLN